MNGATDLPHISCWKREKRGKKKITSLYHSPGMLAERVGNCILCFTVIEKESLEMAINCVPALVFC